MSIWETERAHVIDMYAADARAAGLGSVWDQILADQDKVPRSSPRPPSQPASSRWRHE